MDERRTVAFPSGFVWGAATASYQIEGAADTGGRGRSVWDTFSHTEGKVANGHTGDIACDHYNRLEQDVALMAELGLETYRFSISWSRVMPTGNGPVNPAGLAFYHRLVDLLLEHNIKPCPTLFHWDLPQDLEDQGGFRNRDTVSWFGDYAALMARELGDRVSMWSTFNEPWCYAYLGHAAGVHAPGLNDAKAAITVAHHQLLAHGLALQSMRSERDDLQLGIVINSSNIVSEGSPAAATGQMQLIDAILNRWWFDALLCGEYPQDLLNSYGDLADAIQHGDLETIAQPLDWVGLNYYFDILVKGLTSGEMPRGMMAYPTVTGVTEADQRPQHTDMGWPITPQGLTNLLVRLHTDYPNLPPVYITENGCAYETTQQSMVAVRTHVGSSTSIYTYSAVRDAIDQGVDIRGYFQWSLMDNFEWALGYDKRFGLVHVDFETLARTPRDSAYWYRDVIARNGLGHRPQR